MSNSQQEYAFFGRGTTVDHKRESAFSEALQGIVVNEQLTDQQTVQTGTRIFFEQLLVRDDFGVTVVFFQKGSVPDMGR